jgi:hypothetical protein
MDASLRGDEQTKEIFNPSDLYSPVLNDTEFRILAAITAEHGCCTEI